MAAPLSCIVFALLCCFTVVAVWAEGNGLHRQKRHWIHHPRQLKENHDYSGINIGRIRSDKENFTTILYSLRGPGADEPPIRVFGVDQRTGFLKAYKILDREEIAFYDLKGVATYEDGTRAEKDVDLRITVVDANDNAPIIKRGQVGSVKESCAAGTLAMSVVVADADQEGTLNSQIFYRIVETSSTAGMFAIHSQTGDVSVLRNTLDRETKDTYRVDIRASDLNGQVGGNVGMGEIEIKILDINDNIPTLEKESYEGRVEENTINVEVLRIQAIDLDLEYTDNWLAVFQIISGNEGGYFSITTDAQTNQGIIMIQKELDYEEIQSLNLGVVVSNKAEYDFGSSTSTSITSKSYSVKINVINQKEGPRFQPSVKVVILSEDHTSISINSVITTYTAIDSDTHQTATNVRYVKFRDDDNWLIVNENTAEIRLNKLPDRESKFLINGTYYAQIICISKEASSKTATGTIAIQVKDFNDNCPIVTTTSHTMCLGENVIYVTAVDKDEFPNSAPFEFTVHSTSSHGKWSVEHLNETTAILRDQKHLWPGMYKVAVEIKDQQGKSCADVQMLDVVVCTCEANTRTCMAHIERRSDFGVAGILLLLLGLLLLLLVPLLLLFCLCGGTAADFKTIPFDNKQQLISYHTECQGEDREVPLFHTPDVGQVTISKDINTFGGNAYLAGLAEGGGAHVSGNENCILTTDNVHLYNEYNRFSGHGRMNSMDGGMMTGQGHFSQYRGGAFDDLAVSDHFLEEYYSTKSNHAAQQSQEKDAILVYDYEGGESLSGSVGCCSLHENDNDFSFLDDLDPKFKTLAEICKGSAQVDAGICINPIVRPVSPVRPSTQKQVQTHTETVRDRDQVHVDTLTTSKVMSGTSTIVQEGSSTLSKVHIQDNVVIPSQTLLVQQPALYYAAAPMYVVATMLQHLTLLWDCPLVIVVIFVSGIGGTFQYGFGISSVTSPSAYIKWLVNQTCIQRYDVYLQEWQVSLIWSFTVSIFSIGGLLGSLLAAPCLSTVGRRKCLLFNNLVEIVGAVLMLFSQRAMSFEMIMAGRLLYGINAGISLSAHALYAIECTPKILQGMVGVTIATFIAMGKFVGQLLGLSELLGTEDRWPWLLGFSGFTALFQLVSLPFLPESPKFLLLNQGDQEACEKALTRLWGNKDHSVEVEEMLEEKVALQNIQSRSVMELFRERSICWQLITIIVTFFSLQLSGINAVYFYSHEVFRAAGIHEDQLRYATLGTGMCEMVSSLVCFVIIERTGKKVLLFTGYMAMTLALILLTVTLYLQHHIPWTSYCSMVLIFIFLFSFSIGPGGVVPPLPGVIFTQAFKASAYTVGCTINWIGMFIVGMVFPILVENLDSFSFVIFLLVCLMSGLYVYFNVPETKNKTAKEIAVDFDQMHSKSGRWKGKKRDEQPPDVCTTFQTKF